MSSHDDHRDDHHDDDQDVLAADDALEEVELGEDAAMESDDDEEELILQNDSIAYFDAHKDSVFAIAQHPLYPSLVATGGSEGEGDDAPGRGYVIDTSAAPERPVLPASYNAEPGAGVPQHGRARRVGRLGVGVHDRRVGRREPAADHAELLPAHGVVHGGELDARRQPAGDDVGGRDAVRVLSLIHI